MKESVKFLSVMLMVLSLSLSVVSCSNDDDKENDSIEGTWIFKTASVGEVKTNSATNDEKLKPAIIAFANDNYADKVLVFNSDGTYETIEDEPHNGTYSYVNGELTVDGLTQKVTIENGVLTIYDVDYIEKCNNLELDELQDLGITDIFAGFEITKATANVSFNRQ